VKQSAADARLALRGLTPAAEGRSGGSAAAGSFPLKRRVSAAVAHCVNIEGVRAAFVCGTHPAQRDLGNREGQGASGKPQRMERLSEAMALASVRRTYRVNTRFSPPAPCSAKTQRSKRPTGRSRRRSKHDGKAR